MHKIPTVILLFFMALRPAFAQPGTEDMEDKGERVEAAKVAYITSKLNLSTVQAQQFWPIFNEFETSKKKIRKQIKQLRIGNAISEGTEEQIKADIKKMFQLRQEELDLEKSYSEKFIKAISIKQLAEFYKSEKDFTKMLLNRLHGREKRGRLEYNTMHNP